LSIALANQEYPQCKVAYLHVVDYNHSAIRFYQRNAFTNYVTIKNHYTIFERKYNAVVFFKDIRRKKELENVNQFEKANGKYKLLSKGEKA